ncbi:MAG: hypothetical protein MJE68_15495 [Proteobacteria bacterium]|nr:hypothetical protein [Pseudomonadota bacterium]
MADSGFLKGGLQYSAHEILEATPILVVFETNSGADLGGVQGVATPPPKRF